VHGRWLLFWRLASLLVKRESARLTHACLTLACYDAFSLLPRACVVCESRRRQVDVKLLKQNIWKDLAPEQAAEKAGADEEHAAGQLEHVQGVDSSFQTMISNVCPQVCKLRQRHTNTGNTCMPDVFARRVYASCLLCPRSSNSSLRARNGPSSRSPC
jgi:hypothetical protein